MKAKTIFVSALAGLAGVALVYGLVDLMIEPPGSRLPSSVPNNYESLSACEKQNVLWDRIQATTYKELPDYRSLGLLQMLAMSKQEVSLKGANHSDFAPEGWKKYLHGRASIAKIKIVSAGSKYTGVFQGADCGLLRISLTYKTAGDRAVAPGLALKVLRDRTTSTNISALVSLDGQAKEFNFFKYPMSNIVPIGGGIGQKMVHKIFEQASKYPEELLASEMSLVDAHGVSVNEAVAPRQLFFVPSPTLKFSSEAHDVRLDFAKIPSGTVIYQIRAAPTQYFSFDYSKYTAKEVELFLKESDHVADIVTTSDFVASEFGDDGIFFRHQLRPR